VGKALEVCAGGLKLSPADSFSESIASLAATYSNRQEGCAESLRHCVDCLRVCNSQLAWIVAYVGESGRHREWPVPEPEGGLVGLLKPDHLNLPEAPRSLSWH
jgi:hypothetical protein